jgi:hypothetical protein
VAVLVGVRLGKGVAVGIGVYVGTVVSVGDGVDVETASGDTLVQPTRRNASNKPNGKCLFITVIP